MIKIQKKDFLIDTEIKGLKSTNTNIGAISNFIGYVRSNNNNKNVKYIDLDVYEKMAKKKLTAIIEEAKNIWAIKDCLIIHRFGKLNVGEKIVMVATISEHRKESFLSCQFIMDYLKKDAPFWKKEIYNNEFKWIENIR